VQKNGSKDVVWAWRGKRKGMMIGHTRSGKETRMKANMQVMYRTST
jgi:hypothetical protein